MPRLRWPIAACLALAVVVTGAGAASILSSQGPSPHKALLAVSERLVSARGSVGPDYVQVHGDGVVSPGDALKTDERGTALLTHYDGSTVALGPLTDLVVERLDGNDVRSLYLAVGRVSIVVNKMTSEGSRYEVRTPSAAISVRGTRFVITVTPDGRTEVDVSEGRVDLGAAGGTLTLGAGEGGIVEGPGSRPQRKGVASSPTPPPPSPPLPPQSQAPVTGSAVAFQVDKTAVSLDEPFRYCAPGPVSELMRLGVVYPDGSFRTQGWERTYQDSGRCREFTFESQHSYAAGAYTFRWRLNGSPTDFTVMLTNGNAAPATPPPTTCVRSAVSFTAIPQTVPADAVFEIRAHGLCVGDEFRHIAVRDPNGRDGGCTECPIVIRYPSVLRGHFPSTGPRGVYTLLLEHAGKQYQVQVTVTGP